MTRLFHKYHPIEIDPQMDEEEKVPLMVEWYEEGHELIRQCNLTRSLFTEMVRETPIHYRQLNQLLSVTRSDILDINQPFFSEMEHPNFFTHWRNLIFQF